MKSTGASKTYRAKSMAAALARIRAELGPDAVIISTRRVRASGLLSMGRAAYEVTATRPPTKSKKPTVRLPKNKTENRLRKEIGDLRESITRMREEVRAARAETVQQRDNTDAIVSRLNTEVETASSTLRGVVAEAFLAKRTGLPDAQVEVIQQLIKNGIEPRFAEATVRASLQNSDEVSVVRRAVAEFLMTSLRIGAPLESRTGQRVAAFVGPTGVGKTTTIAKVAAACMIAGRRVGLVTTDTYRIAAVEQLRCYAELMGLRIAVAKTPAQVRQAIDACKNCHVVLVDTAGRSPRAIAEIERMGALLSRAWVDEIHLVMSAQMGSEDIRSTYRSFLRIGIDGVDWTKLDEATRFGALCNGHFICSRPVFYLSAGQRVPEDLESATPERMTRLVLTNPQRSTDAAARNSSRANVPDVHPARLTPAACSVVGF